MSNIAIFDKKTDAVLSYLKSVNTPSYSGRNDVLVNPDVTAVSHLPLRYWKHDNGAIVEMSQTEKDAVDAPAIAEADRIATLRANVKYRLMNGELLSEEEADFIIDN